MAAFSLCEETLAVAAYVAQVVLSNGVCAVISNNVVDAICLETRSFRYRRVCGLFPIKDQHDGHDAYSGTSNLLITDL